MREYLGHAVVDGVPQFFSVSALQKADARSGGCLRAWWYRYVGGAKEVQSESAATGDAMHKEIERYLRTGDKALSALVLSGMHFIPDPGPGVWPELYISPKQRLLTADGVPLIVKIDCVNTLGINKGGDDVTAIYDPPNTVEVIDWKWKRDGAKLEYFMQPAELVHSIQMSGYGVVASKLVPGTERVRLSHGYFPSTRGRPRKVTKLHVVDDCLRSWEYADGLGRTIRHVARETSPERVDANIHSCGKYGGCPYRVAPFNCSAYNKQSLADVFGESESKEIRAMGLMSTLPPNTMPPLPQAAQPAPPPAWTPQGTPQYQQAMQAAYPPVTATPAGVSAQLDMRAQIAAEEQALRQQQNAVMQGQTAPAPSFTEAAGYISASGRGFPKLIGAAAIAAWAAGGQNVPPGTEYPGHGDLGAMPGLMLSEPQQVIDLAKQMGFGAQPAPAPAPQAPVHVQHNTVPQSVLPVDAPASDPALAAKPVEGWPVQPPQPVQQWQAQPPPAPMLYTQPGAPLVAPAEPAKKTRAPRGSKKPSSDAPVAVQQPPTAIGQMTPNSTAVTPSFPAAVSQVAQAAGAEGDLAIFVDCIPNGEYESLHPYVDKLCDVLCQRYVAPGGLRDIRCAPKDSPLGYGGWRGGIAAMVRELPPGPGRYFLDTRGNEIAGEVADALRVLCEQQGGDYTRGIR